MIALRKPHARSAAGCDSHDRLEAERLDCTGSRVAVSVRVAPSAPRLAHLPGELARELHREDCAYARK
jgi:hypothetical protein